MGWEGGTVEQSMTWLLLMLIPMTAAAAPQLPLSPQQSIVERTAHCWRLDGIQRRISSHPPMNATSPQ